MDKQGRIRLSTMEIVLIAAMLGTLLLGLLQAFAEERSRRLSIETNHEHYRLIQSAPRPPAQHTWEAPDGASVCPPHAS